MIMIEINVYKKSRLKEGRQNPIINIKKKKHYVSSIFLIPTLISETRQIYEFYYLQQYLIMLSKSELIRVRRTTKP